MIKNRIPLVAVSLVCAASLTGCFLLPTVADEARSAFDRAVPSALLASADGSFSLESPGGERLLVARDFGGKEDVVLEIPLAEFAKAGLEPARLPAAFGVDGNRGVLRITMDVLVRGGPYASFSGALGAILDASPGFRSYHQPLNRFGVRLPESCLVEWSVGTIDKPSELSFSFDPDPFLKAGLNPLKLLRWSIVKARGDDGSGRIVPIPRLTRTYIVGE